MLSLRIGSINVNVENTVEALMRKHEELFKAIKEIEDKLNELVTEKIVTPYGTVEKAQSVRYDNEAIVRHLEESGRLTQEIKSMFTIVDNTKVVNYFKLPQASKEPFKKLGDPILKISHSSRK